jgi:acyl transferase domain-containing protein
MTKQSSTDIAIVGIGSLFPGAKTTREFWLNILQKVHVLEEIPKERWDWRLYFDADRTAPDRIYAKWGGFLPDIPFDPLNYGIPPNTIKAIDPAQLLTLEVARLALEDAGAFEKEFDRENTSVFIGATMGMNELGHRLTVRTELPQLVGSIPQETLDRLPEWSETGLVGTLQNVYAGRVANRFDLGGTNQVIDAACASSLASVSQACQELIYGDANFALAGGVDIGQGTFDYMSLAKTQALSPTGKSLPFDKKADGIVLGEGIGIVALKRYEDALAEDDRIYARIKGWGSSSDGRAKSLFNPFPAGQKRALDRAYKRAGFPISSLSLFCAHGTGTVAGDGAEVATIIDALKEAGADSNSVALHSIKAQVGHTKGSAGIASFIEASLALHHRVIPPQMEVDEPLDIIADPESPVYLIEEAQPWIHHPDHPRRAGVSAFGFGGTNFHIVLEEVPEENTKPVDASMSWSIELFLFKGNNRPELIKQAESLIADLKNGADPRFCDLAYSTIKRSWDRKEQPATLMIVAKDLDQLAKSLTRALPHLKNEATWPLDNNIRIMDSLEAKGEKVAFLFPGQGSQYADQGAELVSLMPELEKSISRIDKVLEGRYPGKFSDKIYPPSQFAENDTELRNKEFLNPRHSGLALACFQHGMIELARSMELEVKSVAGHSLGEPSAIYYAGHITLEDWVDYFDRRMERMHKHYDEVPTQLLAVGLDQVQALGLALQYPSLNLANYNATNQTVIGGTLEDIEAFRKNPDNLELQTYKVQLTGAYHCTQYHSLRPELRKINEDLQINLDTDITAYSGNLARPFNLENDSEIREQFALHLTVPVDWVDTVRQMYEDGVRVFVELGPRALLTNLCDNVLIAKRPWWAVSFDGEGGGLRGLLTAIGTLAGLGVEFNLPFIYERRDVKLVDLDNLVETTAAKPLRPTTWYVNGGSARPMKDPVGSLGKIPALTLETKQELVETKSQNGAIADAMQPGETVKNPNEPPAIPDFQPDMNPQQVMAEYQRRMQMYLERQEAAMQAYMAAAQQSQYPQY